MEDHKKTPIMDISTYSTKHPPSLYLLTFTEFWDRFSYYGIQSLLVIYLTKTFLLSDAKAYSLYGAYTAMTFAIPVLGGMLADKMVNLLWAIITGTVLITAGNLLLSTPTLPFVYLGLAVLICGIGLLKPCNTTMAGTLYAKNDQRLEGGFTLFYIGMNSGALAGPIVYGLIVAKWGMSAGFLVSAAGMLLSTLLLLLKNKTLQNASYEKPKILKATQAFILIPGVLAAILAFKLLLEYPDVFSKLFAAFGIATLAYFLWIAFRSTKQARNNILLLLTLLIFSLFFFACSLQIASSLLLFIDRVIDRQVFGWQIPTMMFLSISPAFIIILAPMMAKLSIKSHPLNKIAFGILCAALAFIIFAITGFLHFSTNSIALLLIILGNFFLGLGELCILPVLMSAVRRLAPSPLKAMMMGTLFLALAFSGFFAGLIAKLTSPESMIQKSLSLQMIGVHYGHVFVKISLAAILISVMAFSLTPLVRRLEFV